MDQRKTTRQLAANFLARGGATGWFEALYAQAEGDPSAVPWADLGPNPTLVRVWPSLTMPGGARVLVVGCGLGDDAAWLTQQGCGVTAFDISATAIQWCRQRYPHTSIQFEVADALQPPPRWEGAFDFVFEAYTLQALPGEVRPPLIRQLPRWLAPGGQVLVVCRGKEAHQQVEGPPWPLSPEELSPLERGGLTLIQYQDFTDGEDPPQRRLMGVWRREGITAQSGLT